MPACASPVRWDKPAGITRRSASAIGKGIQRTARQVVTLALKMIVHSGDGRA
jgi:hypothetical protein